MNRYQDIVGRINYILFLIIVFMLPFPQLPLRYACVAWFTVWVLEGRWLSKPTPVRQNKTAIPFILFGIWFVWQAVSYFWCADKIAWGVMMERHLTFALIVPVGIWGVNKHYNLRRIEKVFVAGCLTAIPAYLLWMAALFSHPEWESWLHLSEPLKYFDNWRAFLVENISLFKHRLFLCSVELFGAVMAIQIWHNKKWALVLTLPVMLSPIAFTSSRQSVLTLIAMTAVGIISMLPQAHRRLAGAGIVLVAIIAGGCMMMFHPRMQQFDLEQIQEMQNISYEHEHRLNIWAIALQNHEDYLAYGLGTGQSTNYLIDKYRQTGFDYYASMRFNAHNQYLEQLMELGIPGLLFFLLAWMSLPLCANGAAGKRTAWLFLTLYTFNMFTDIMFGMFCGIALWAVGMVIILLQSNELVSQEHIDAYLPS